MSTVPALPCDIHVDPDGLLAAGFLATYSEPNRGVQRVNLSQWLTWCHDHGLAVLEVKRAHIELYARHLSESRGLKASTVANKLGTISHFYHYAVLDRHLTINPAEHVKRPAVARESTRAALNRVELLGCLDIAEHSSTQDHAVWCVLGLNGLRVGELCSLNVEDLGRHGGYRTLLVHREKGNRPGRVPLAPRTAWAVEQVAAHHAAGALFRTRQDQRVDRKAVARIVERVATKAGITGKRLTPHSLRHTMITLALNAGCSVRDISNSMGYADSRTVNYYDRDKDNLARNSTHMVAAYIEAS